jgi:hypothetical protein
MIGMMRSLCNKLIIEHDEPKDIDRISADNSQARELCIYKVEPRHVKAGKVGIDFRTAQHTTAPLRGVPSWPLVPVLGFYMQD